MWIDRRILAAAAAASVLLNIFLVGVVAGWLLTGRAQSHLDHWGGPLVVRNRVRTLPLDERQAFRSAMAQHRAAIATAREAHRRARRKTEEDIAAPNFDRAKVAADFADLRQASVALQDALNDALVSALAGLPQAARAALVNHEVTQHDK